MKRNSRTPMHAPLRHTAPLPSCNSCVHCIRAGLQWTTYRQMAEDTIDAALAARPDIKPTNPSRTRNIVRRGGEEGEEERRGRGN